MWFQYWLLLLWVWLPSFVEQQIYPPPPGPWLTRVDWDPAPFDTIRCILSFQMCTNNIWRVPRLVSLQTGNHLLNSSHTLPWGDDHVHTLILCINNLWVISKGSISLMISFNVFNVLDIVSCNRWWLSLKLWNIFASSVQWCSYWPVPLASTAFFGAKKTLLTHSDLLHWIQFNVVDILAFSFGDNVYVGILFQYYLIW